MDIGVPAGLAFSNLPRWLRDAAESGDHGKKVSDKFLRIERTEQSRMREAYSVVGPADIRSGTHNDITKVQLSGIEKGGKNRYKDILPFEHARVRLVGRPEGTCDYVNASHLQAKRSHKRYIASQGPLPATFEVSIHSSFAQHVLLFSLAVTDLIMQDFWSVVWDNDVRVIIMLTAESEGGQLKCHPYWKGNDFGPVKLRVLSEKKISLDIDKRRPPATAAMATTDGYGTSSGTSSPDALPLDAARRRANTTTTLGTGPQTANQFAFPPNAAAATEPPHVIVRKFALSHTAHPFSPIREVTQLHYPSWPDFGAPAQPSHLLALVELANIMQRGVPPRDAPGTSTSAPVPRQNSGLTGDAASNPFFAHHSSDRDSSAGFRRTDGDGMPLAWPEGPEPQKHPRPLLVHCSAGCGRTGAFCTVDSVIDMLKRQKQHMLGHGTTAITGRAQPGPLVSDPDGDISMNEGTAGADPLAIDQPDTPLNIDTSWLDDDTVDLIAQTVEDFRGQRLSMVQSLRQFVLCYETVLEWARRLQEDGDGGVDGKGRGRSGSLAF
jgi:protein-tyrosine phosphatase